MNSTIKNTETKKRGPCRHGCFKFFPLIFLVIVALKAAAVFYLWNALIPTLFQGPVVTYWQALGLLVLSKLLFGFGHRGGGPRHLWKKRWMALSEEERAKLREAIHDRCHH